MFYRAVMTWHFCPSRCGFVSKGTHLHPNVFSTWESYHCGFLVPIAGERAPDRRWCHCIISVQFLPLIMDWVLERTVHRGFLGAILGDEVFTDSDCADDVSLLEEMLYVFYS